MPSPEAESWRLFVALPVPQELHARILRIQEHLREKLRGGELVWTQPAQFHLTLRFLGSVAAEQVPALGQALEGVARRFAPLTLEAVALGCFPDPRRPRVLWLGIQDEARQLSLLQRAVTESTLAWAPEDDARPFHGHVTLARVKSLSPSRAREMSHEIATSRSLRVGGWIAASFDLMRSELGPHGARHSLLQRCIF